MPNSAQPNEIIFAIVAIALTAVILTVFFVLLVVVFQRNMVRKQKELFRAVLDSQEMERERIGRDLHDDIGPLLSAVKLMLEGIKVRYADVGNGATTEITKLSGVLDKAVSGVRIASHDLVPTALLRSGLCNAIEDQVIQINDSGLVKVSYTYPDICDIEMFTARNIYRVVQELLNNAVKHAQATTIDLSITMKENGSLTIEIADNGTGFDVQKAKGGIGLRNIASRVKVLNGQTLIESELGKGARFTITIDKITRNSSPSNVAGV